MVTRKMMQDIEKVLEKNGYRLKDGTVLHSVADYLAEQGNIVALSGSPVEYEIVIIKMVRK